MEANKPTTEYVIAPNHNDTFWLWSQDEVFA
jgi:hypothetical protein